MRGPRADRRRGPGHSTREAARALSSAPAANRSAAATFTYEEQLARNTGWQTPTQSWEAAQRRGNVLRAQTEAMADDLETHGVAARRTGKNITVLGDVTGGTKTSTEYRAIRFLPLIAQRDRAPMLNALRYFQ